MSPLLFDNGWTDRNADCCVNTIDKKNTAATNLVNVCPVSHEIVMCVCMDGDCRKTDINITGFKGQLPDNSNIASL